MIDQHNTSAHADLPGEENIVDRTQLGKSRNMAKLSGLTLPNHTSYRMYPSFVVESVVGFKFRPMTTHSLIKGAATKGSAGRFYGLSVVSEASQL